MIYKRYSHFHALHQELLKAQQLPLEQKVLPALPPKRLTRSLAVEFVEKRKNELQDYLRALLETPGLVHSPIMLNFLEVPDSVRPMLAAANQGLTSLYPGLDLKDMPPDAKDSIMNAKSSYQHKSYEERRILELINLLKFHPNKSGNI